MGFVGGGPGQGQGATDLANALKLTDFCQILKQAGLNATLEGPDRLIHSVNTLESASDGEITFLSNLRYAAEAKKTKASAIIAKPGAVVRPQISVVRCDDPYAAVTVAIIHLHGHRKHPQWGLSPQAVIHPSVRIGRNPNIAPNVTIDEGVLIGDNCTIYPGCYIARGVAIGNDCTLFPNVVIYDECALGNRVTIHAGSVIGEDGLGYAPRGEHWLKIPQVGRTVIGDDVEIGANCAIDRATLGKTEIGPGTKFGNVVVIGHGTKIGPDCLLVGLIGVAGSVTVGKHVTMAGQVGVAGHIEIGDGASVGAQSGIVGDVPPNANMLGSPAMPLETARRSVLLVQKLPEWTRRIRELEKQVEELRTQLAVNSGERATP